MVCWRHRSLPTNRGSGPTKLRPRPIPEDLTKVLPPYETSQHGHWVSFPCHCSTLLRSLFWALKIVLTVPPLTLCTSARPVFLMILICSSYFVIFTSFCHFSFQNTSGLRTASKYSPCSLSPLPALGSFALSCFPVLVTILSTWQELFS